MLVHVHGQVSCRHLPGERWLDGIELLKCFLKVRNAACCWSVCQFGHWPTTRRAASVGRLTIQESAAPNVLCRVR